MRMFVSREKREELSELLRGLLKPSRYEHSLNVASSAVLLAKRYGEDEEKAYLAGLLHDICKNLPYEEQYAYMRREPSLPEELPKELFENRKLWHAPAGAVYIREELKIVDEDIIAAVKYHTTARAGMSLLEKIIYTADFISADRTYEGVEAIRAKAFSDIDEAVLEGTAFSLGKLIGQRKTINRDTLEAYNEGCAKLKKRKGTDMKTEEKLKKIAEILENKKAENLRIFKVLELTSLTDYFIVVNGTSTTHIKALADEVEVEMRKLGEESRFEGKASDWLLLDFGDIITHIFLPTAREKYNLEKLWSEAEEFDTNKLHTI